VLARASAFELETYARTADAAEEHPLGVALRSDRHGILWILNQLWVDGPHPELTAPDLIAELDRLYPHASHRRTFVTDDATGARHADGMRDAGLMPARYVTMVLDREPPEPPPGVAREVDDATLRATEVAILTADDGKQPSMAEAIAGARAALRASRPGTRCFAGARNGVDACHVTLYSDGATAQIEDVGTLVAHRGHGLAGATVALAAREALRAGHDLVWLLCDVDDGPIPLYERTGFRIAGPGGWSFTRPG
jgi:GNAT superfamily N-acetyltransferase